MNSDEMLGGLIWHLECMSHSATAIESFRPPADGFQMRMHHSHYLVNFVAAIDVVRDSLQSEDRKSYLAALEGTAGAPTLSGLPYMRELRNSVVHRGMDLISSAVIIDDFVYAIAPFSVRDRNGNASHVSPTILLRDAFSHAELCVKPIIERALNGKIHEIESRDPADILDEIIKISEASKHAPDWVKAGARNVIREEWVVEARTTQMSKLRCLLKSAFNAPAPQATLRT